MLLKYADVEADFEVYDKYFNEVLNELNKDTDRSKKVYVLKNDMKKMKEKFPLERLKLLIKTIIEQKLYKDAINLMMTSCQIEIKHLATQTSQATLGTDPLEFINELEFIIPSTCNTYIRALLVVCLIHLDYKKEDSLISVLYENDIEQCAGEFKLLADTYYFKKNYLNAKHYYHLLLTNVREFLVQLDIWLKYGNCCSFLNEIDDAINAFRNAVNLDSSSTEAALSLVNILKKNSSLFDEAANVINNTLSHRKTHQLTKEILNLKINQCFIQYEKGEYQAYIQNAHKLLYGYLEFVLEQKNISSLIRVDSKVQRAIVFHQMLEENNYEMEFQWSKLNPETQNAIFEIYLKLCKVCVKLKQYDQLLIYSVGATVLPLVYERMDWNKSINFSCLIACILKNDGKNAFNILKDFIIEFKNSNKLWSYVGIVIGLFPSLNQQKFFIRLGAKFMDHLPLCLINAHFAIMSGTYRYALVEYMNCFKQNPYDPFINLIISITYCHISCQKYNTKRHLLVSQVLFANIF
jgi:general transcription factor 3C polypeptide 3 (transcription factor C subunit 4)